MSLADKETFALYGFRIEIPRDWRVELNPKTNREKGDVAFHSPKGNRFFVSWGPLDDAKKRFASLQDHRDKSVKQIRKGSDVNDVAVESSHEEIISGHNALFSNVNAEVRAGGPFSRATYERTMSSVHMYCPSNSRYYVVYSLLRDPTEYPDFRKLFEETARSFVCH